MADLSGAIQAIIGAQVRHARGSDNAEHLIWDLVNRAHGWVREAGPKVVSIDATHTTHAKVPGFETSFECPRDVVVDAYLDGAKSASWSQTGDCFTYTHLFVRVAIADQKLPASSAASYISEVYLGIQVEGSADGDVSRQCGGPDLERCAETPVKAFVENVWSRRAMDAPSTWKPLFIRVCESATAHRGEDRSKSVVHHVL